MVAIGSRDRPHIGRSTQGLPLVGSSLKSAISRQIRKEEKRNGEVSRGRQDSRVRKRKGTATACTCQPSLGDKGTPIWALQSNHQASGSYTRGCAGRGREAEGSRMSTGTRSCADTGNGTEMEAWSRATVFTPLQ